MVDVALLEDVLTTAESIIRGVPPGTGESLTPCPDYQVATLVNHMVGWMRIFADAATGQTPSTPRDGYVAGEAPADEFHEAATRVVEGFRAGAAERPINLGNGETPGAVVFNMMLMEYIGHGWDLAAATGQPAPFSEAAVTAALEAARAMLKPEYRGPGKPFGDAIPQPDDAPPLDQLIGCLGRDPTWPHR